MRIAKRWLSLFAVGALAFLMGSLTAWAAGDDATSIRIEGASLQTITSYTDQSDQVLETLSGDPVPVELKEVSVVLHWENGNSQNYQLSSKADGSWFLTTSETSIPSVSTLSEAVFTLTDTEQNSLSFTADQAAIKDAYKKGGYQGLNFDQLVCQKADTIQVKTGQITITADFLMDNFYYICPSEYVISLSALEGNSWLSTKVCEGDPQAIAKQEWTLTLPVGLYTLTQTGYQDGSVVVPTVSGAEPAGNGWRIEVKAGEATKVEIRNDYYDAGCMTNLSFSSPPSVKAGEQAEVTCSVSVDTPYPDQLLPGIQCYLESNGKSIGWVRRSLTERAATFSFAVDYPDEETTYTCFATLGQKTISETVIIPPRGPQTASVQLVHRYGQEEGTAEEVKPPAGETLSVQWIKNHGLADPAFPEGVKRASAWRLFEVPPTGDPVKIAGGSVEEGQFNGLATDFKFSAGQNYRLELDYQTRYRIEHYLQVDTGSEGAVEWAGKHYLLEADYPLYLEAWLSVGSPLPQIQSYEGYRYRAADLSLLGEQNRVLEDGSTVIRLYYDQKATADPAPEETKRPPSVAISKEEETFEWPVEAEDTLAPVLDEPTVPPLSPEAEEAAPSTPRAEASPSLSPPETGSSGRGVKLLLTGSLLLMGAIALKRRKR